MADFRRCIPVLALLALMVGFSSLASAQSTPAFSCFANAGVPPVVRAEDVTALVGDLILNCTGGTPTAPGATIPPVNIQIFLNTNITSKIIGGSPLTEALLFLDDPGPQNPGNPAQTPCLAGTGTCFNVGNGQGQGLYGLPYYVGQPGGGTNFNVFQGQIAPGRTDSILWLGVPIDPPGTNGTRIIRINNIRAHAPQLGTGTVPVPITELVTATGTFSVPINQPNQTVAVIQKSLAFSVRNSPTSFQQCFSQGTFTSGVPTTGTRAATLRYSELLATAFKKYNVGSSDASPTTAIAQNNFLPSLNTETGFYNPAFPITNGLNVAGLPNFGTRLQAIFNNVPAGVFLTVATSATSGSPVTDIARLVVNGSTGYVAATSGVISLTSGSGTATWEITQSDAQSFATLDFNVNVTYTANPGGNSPAIGPTATVAGSYSPITTVFVASTNSTSATAVPRFVDTSTASNIFSIVPCVTNLLFPFVTNQAGFDTGLAISSTSTDPFGTSPQSGTCTLNWYGAAAPAATLTPVVASGTSYTTLASIAAPGFQGYMIAQCRFQYGHGFAFVSDLGARNIAMGYLALIIPDPARSPTWAGCAAGGGAGIGCVASGEILGQ